VATTVIPRTGEDSPRPPTDPRDAPDPAFLRWGMAAYLATTAVVVAAVVAWVGRLTYTLDDAAIHLGMADRLAHDGTWGVVAGRFESASSSPLWTVLLAAGVRVTGPAADWVPLVLNVAAGATVVWLLAHGQRSVRPGRARPVDAATTILLVVAVLFLPGLAIVGMEHTLHLALVLAAVLCVHRWVLDLPGPRPAVTYALVALGSLTRFETAFVAVGLALALVVVDRPRWLRRAAAVTASSAVPIAAFCAFNRVMGGGWLPNSLLVKGQVPGEVGDDSVTPAALVQRAATDPLLLVLVAAAAVYVVMRGRRGAAFVPALTLVVATLLHVVLADVGWYERYQAYLLGVGAYVLLAVIAELPARTVPRALLAVCVVGVVLAIPKLQHTIVAPRAADDMHRQQYQAGQFLARYYDGEPVATDQLGYIGYLHHGPLTDFAGLGDHEVLERRDDSVVRDLWEALEQERGFRVVVVYDLSGANAPEGWIRVGHWRIHGARTTGVTRNLVFYATDPDEVGPLRQHLADFEPVMAARSELILDEGAPLRAMAVAAAEREQGAGG
jgi:hypothetical protein